MADKKISALTGATTPLDGTEVLPIVQSGATVKVANNDLRPKQIQSNATSGVLQVAGPASAATRVMTTPDANFTAARTDAAQSFTGDQTFATGNLVIGTDGKGIDFSVTSSGSGTMTSELLADYEEGTWTPVVGGSATYNTQIGSYTKVGRLVYVRFNLNILAIGSGSTTVVSGLPFTPSATRMAGSMAYWAGLATNVLYLGTFVDNSGFNFISQIIPGTDVTDGTAILGSGTVIHAAAVYFV